MSSNSGMLVKLSGSAGRLDTKGVLFLVTYAYVLSLGGRFCDLA